VLPFAPRKVGFSIESLSGSEKNFALKTTLSVAWYTANLD
jgi:hypothetical protein